MLAFTQHNLGKIEDLFAALGYQVRYEKGSFKTAACVLQNTRVVVVNRFSNLEVRIKSLLRLLHGMEVDLALLDEKTTTFYKGIKKEEGKP